MSGTPTLAVLLALLVHGDAALGQSPARPPPPSPGERMPGMERRDVARVLRKMRWRFGDDAVTIQTGLVMHTVRSGAQRGTGIRIHEIDDFGSHRYLRFELDTGLVFDSRTRDRDTRLRYLWTRIVLPTIGGMTQLTVPADGVLMAMRSHHRPYDSTSALLETIDDPGTVEETRFYLLVDDVLDLAAKRVAPDGLLERATIVVDGVTQRTVPSPGAVPKTPGPP